MRRYKTLNQQDIMLSLVKKARLLISLPNAGGARPYNIWGSTWSAA
jgi:hypothetical protein